MTGSIRRLSAAVALALCATLTPAATAAPGAAGPPPPPSDAELAAQPARHDLTREQFYFVLPDRFANGSTANDRGGLTGDRLTTGYDPGDKSFYQGGDLKGLTERLDYIKGLGTTAIWLAPVFKNTPVTERSWGAAANYHGYAITDFTRVDPHFGTNEELRELIDAAHAKGMKVMFDILTNHTADTIRYAEQEYGYRPEGAYPYLDRQGRPFDDDDGVPRVDEDAFAYTPRVAGEDREAKVPAWLNDPTMYHNRGETSFSGESGLNGDFAGGDDLWTERPEVVRGMAKIYQRWVRDFGIDGFRIDTAKNVNLDFWTQWATALEKYAAEQGHEDFFMFGESYSAEPAVNAPYITRGRLDSTLDFPFQAVARVFASRGGAASVLSDVFSQDYRYTTGRSNAYEQVTFLGSHDMGRIGGFIAQDNPGADDAELLRRDRLAHELMFFSRGNTVVYAGDEQGFTGPAGDSEARQPMFATRVPDYLDDDRIGTDATHAEDAYDTSAPLYRTIAGLSRLTKRHPALRDGIQRERYADEGPGVYAFSRTDPRERVEYVVAVNNAETARTVEIPTDSADAAFRQLYGGRGTARTSDGATLRVTVPALSSVVYRADRALPAPATAPDITLTAPAAGATGTVEVTAEVTGGGLNRVVFAAQRGDGPWQVLGSADHAPYRVTQFLPDTVRGGEALRYKAVVVDGAGRTASALASTTAGASPPEEKPSVVRDHAVVHYQRPDGDYDGWELKTADGAVPFAGRDAYGAFAWVGVGDRAGKLDFTIEKDGAADGPPRTLDLTVAGEVWTEQGSGELLTTAPDGAYPPQDEEKAVIHYHRPDGDYDGWGLHTWAGAAHPTDWDVPLMPVRRDGYGITFEVPVQPGAESLSYVLHKREQKDLDRDQNLVFDVYGKEIWLLAGKPRYLLPAMGPTDLDLGVSKARLIDRDTVVWPDRGTGTVSEQLVYPGKGGELRIEDGALSDEGHWLRLNPTTLTDAQQRRHPELKGLPAYRIDPRDRDRLGTGLRRGLIATRRTDSGALMSATGVRIAPGPTS